MDLFDPEEQPDATTNNQGGPFVMYNCARLAMLFENFRKAVKQGNPIHDNFKVDF